MGFWPRANFWLNFGYGEVANDTSHIMKGDDFMNKKFNKSFIKASEIIRANPKLVIECIEAACKETAEALNERIEADKDIIAEVERRTMQLSSEVFD